MSELREQIAVELFRWRYPYLIAGQAEYEICCCETRTILSRIAEAVRGIKGKFPTRYMSDPSSKPKYYYSEGFRDAIEAVLELMRGERK